MRRGISVAVFLIVMTGVSLAGGICPEKLDRVVARSGLVFAAEVEKVERETVTPGEVWTFSIHGVRR